MYACMHQQQVGVAVLCSVVSTCLGINLRYGKLGMTGSLSLSGEVLEVRGITTKLDHAVSAKRKTVIIPKANHEEMMTSDDGGLEMEDQDDNNNTIIMWHDLELMPVGDILELMRRVFPTSTSTTGGGHHESGEWMMYVRWEKGWMMMVMMMMMMIGDEKKDGWWYAKGCCVCWGE